MKILKKLGRTIGYFLLIMLLFQSCRVYQGQKSTLDEAVQLEKRVKIRTLDGVTLKFKKVEQNDKGYYGIYTSKGTILQTPIDENNIEALHFHNKAMSIIGTSFIGLVCLVYVVIIIVF